MQKNIVFTVFVVLFLLFTAFKNEDDSNLKVRVTGFEEKASTKIYISVFSKKNFLETSLQTKSVTATGDEVTVEFELPSGEYAVSTYHDVNNNSELDRYFFGKPKEPYGFSNNVKSLGPPDFEECVFTLNNSLKTISIKLID